MTDKNATSGSAAGNRSLALDALRGFAILAMVLSGAIPFGVLPSWMYHAQVPPPKHVFDPNIPGITWVDLVFPFFLFSMGAAIPLAISSRIKKGAPNWRIFFGIIGRFFLLGAFAVYIEHVRPYVLNPSPTKTTWTLALLGFVLLFPVLVRLPGRWNIWPRLGVRIIGWAGIVVFMWWMRYPDGSGFSVDRSDIIIKLLANAALAGSIVWLFSQTNNLVRFGVMGILMAFRLSSAAPGWVQVFQSYSPIPWLFQWSYLQYLFVVIPGTIVGDMILGWMRHKGDSGREWSSLWLAMIALLAFLFIPLMLICLKVRWVWQGVVASITLCLLLWQLVKRPSSNGEKLVSELFKWGSFLLILGLCFEPYEGGIKKDSATMSYYFVTSGLAIFLLISFFITIDVLKKKWFGLLVANGQNPMIAYAGEGNLIPPLLALTGLDAFLASATPTPWLGVLQGAFVTLLLALCVCGFTRLKVHWRT